MEIAAKRLNQNDVVEAGRWENMNGEILGLILSKVSSSSNKIICLFSLVCKGWLEVLIGPYCWSDIDLQKWSSKCFVTKVDPVVRHLVGRSQFTTRRLSVCRLGNFGFASAATCGRFLTVLQIPVSRISDDIVEKHVGSLVNLKELDISCCLGITCKGLSYFGNSCRSLTILKRNFLPRVFHKLDESEAYAIANTMTGLCRLELADGCFGDCGLNAILTNCKSLTHLDIDGCQNVSLDFVHGERYLRILGFKNSNGIWYTGEFSESSSGDDSDEESCVTSNVVNSPHSSESF